MQTFVHGESCSVSHTETHLRAVPLALGSPFGIMFFTAITPSAALCGKMNETYLLFLIGLTDYNTAKPICQYFFAKNHLDDVKS